jgi:hypothetical protein
VVSLISAERMGGGAEVMGGAARRGVTSDSRVRSSRDRSATDGRPGRRAGAGGAVASNGPVEDVNDGDD